MKQIIFKEKYPVFTLSITKDESRFSSTDEIISYFQEKISSDPIAQYISIFDHFTHTKKLEAAGKAGEIPSDIKDAKNIIFCFGKEIPTPVVLAVRPRSIGVVEFSDRFVISFMETPHPDSTKTVENWITSVVK